MEAMSEVNIKPPYLCRMRAEGWIGVGKTNVGDVDLTTTTSSHDTTAASAAVATSAEASLAHSAAEAATRTAGTGTAGATAGLSKSRFRLAILVPTSISIPSHRSREKPYFADVDESSHQVLVAESRNGVLGLLPRSIFHNSAKPSVIVLS